MRISVIAVGRLRPPFTDDNQHYHKLLAGLGRVEVTEVREDEDVPRGIPDRAYVILMSAEGQTMSPIEFSRWLQDRRQEGQELCSVVAGPKVLQQSACALILSLGRFRLPHQLARVVLLEQLVRAH